MRWSLSRRSSMQKTLIIVRHGEERGGELTVAGAEQMRNLAGRLSRYVKDEQSIVLCSPIDYADESGRALAEELWIPYKCCDVLKSPDISDPILSEEGILEAIELAGRKINGNSMEVTIIVTHREWATELPYFLAGRFNLRNFYHRTVPCGSACVIDFETRTITYLE